MKSTRVVGNIPVDLDLDPPGRRYLFISRDQRALTHALHRYPAKFFPELPRFLIQRYSEVGDLVLDPFCGSGTMNLEASLLSRPSIGVDIDPFARFLARVKTTPIDVGLLQTAQGQMVRHIGQYSESSNPVLPEFPYRDAWFSPHVLRELAYIKEGVQSFDGSLRNFLMLTFSSIIRRSSQADNSITKTTILKKKSKQVAPGYALDLFLRQLAHNIDGMDALGWFDMADVNIPDGMSATDLGQIESSICDLALTSPPYLTAVDYPRTHQLEMYWLDMPAASANMKRGYIGTESVSAAEYETPSMTGVDSADVVLRELYQVDPRRAFIAYKFLTDLFGNLREVRRVLKYRSRYVIVVGSNVVKGQEFETWRYLRDAAPDLGYEVESWFLSAIIRHTGGVPQSRRINDDYVLILRKKDG